MKKVLGIDVDISVYISKEENNCFAMIGQGGRRMIVADHLFLAEVNRDAGTRWAAISILAHELGHHIAGFGRYASSRLAELDADYWSGYILQQLGLSEDAAVKCIMRYGTEADTDSHPNKYSRAATIREGWNDGVSGDFEAERCEGCGD